MQVIRQGNIYTTRKTREPEDDEEDREEHWFADESPFHTKQSTEVSYQPN